MGSEIVQVLDLIQKIQPYPLLQHFHNPIEDNLIRLIGAILGSVQWGWFKSFPGTHLTLEEQVTTLSSETCQVFQHILLELLIQSKKPHLTPVQLHDEHVGNSTELSAEPRLDTNNHLDVPDATGFRLEIPAWVKITLTETI